MFSRRQFLQFLGGMGVFGASTAAYGFAEPVTRLGITRYDIQPPQWPADFQLRIAAVADIHACDPWMSLPHIEAIVERTNALNADIIVLLATMSRAIATSPASFPPRNGRPCSPA